MTTDRPTRNNELFPFRTGSSAVLIVFFVLGAYAVVTQSLVVREFLVLFFGNELSWGLTFFGWLAGVGIGAASGGRVSRHERARLPAFVGAMALLTLLAPALIVIIRVIRGAFDVGPGEYLPLWTMLWLTPLLTAPVSFLVGFAFPLASSLISASTPDAPSSVVRSPCGAPDGGRATRDPDYKGMADPITRIYIVEALGSLVGGALFSFVLIEHVPGLMLATVSGSVLILAVFGVMKGQHGRRLLSSWLCLAMFALIWFWLQLQPAGWGFERWTIEKRWDTFGTGTEIVRPSPVDSRYQNITLAESEGQYTVFLDGLGAMTFPDERALAVDAHFVMSQAKSVRRVLVIGGGVEGLLAEMLTYPPEHLERLDYVMLDPKLLELVRPHLAERDRAALDDPRLRVHYDDGRHYLRVRRDRYDLILLNLPEPSSILLNRFYTETFFRLAASRLAEDGLLAFTLDLKGSPNYLTDLQRRLLGSVCKPLDRALPQRMVTWSERPFVLAAARKGVFSADRDELARRYAERAPRTDPRYAFMVDGADDRLDVDKRADMRREIDAGERIAPPNTDDRPVTYLYTLILWDRITDESFLALLARVDFTATLIVLAGVFALWLLIARFGLRRSGAESATLFSVASTGFTTMSLELVLLVVFQSLYGYVYARIGVIVGVFMLGLVGGSLFVRRIVARKPDLGTRTLRTLDLGIGVFAAALPTVCALLADLQATWVVEWSIMLLVLLTGLLGGSIFPLAANVLVREKRATGRAAGAVDAADHVGACIGALITGVVLIPAIGLTATCLSLAALKLLAATALLFTRQK